MPQFYAVRDQPASVRASHVCRAAAASTLREKCEETAVSSSRQLAAPQVRDTVRTDPVSSGGAVISEERRHFLLRQPQTSSLVAVTPRAASDQGVGQRPQGHSIDRWTRPTRYDLARALPEQPSNDGA